MESTLIELPPALPAPPRVYTPEDLLRMPDAHRFELVDGKLETRPMSIESSRLAAKLLRRMGDHIDEHKLGSYYGADCGYQMWPDRPNQVRFADGSFVRKDRLPGRNARTGHFKLAPDLAVESISPNDKAEELETKRVEYLQAGVRLLWIIYPRNLTVHVFRPDGTATVIDATGELSGEDVLPGFVCKLAELFDED